MEAILRYFPDLNPRQRAQFERLGPAYRLWNSRINVISRKDIDQLYPHHLLHSLAIARVLSFRPGARVLDLGTGGGLPGIPLAILFPDTHFILIDGTGKKIKVVEAIAQAAGLDNVEARHQRAEQVKDAFDFVVCRAVARLDQLLAWSLPLIHDQQRHALPNGLLALKGGRVQAEIDALPGKPYTECFPIRDFFQEPYFTDKHVVYVQA